MKSLCLGRAWVGKIILRVVLPSLLLCGCSTNSVTDATISKANALASDNKLSDAEKLVADRLREVGVRDTALPARAALLNALGNIYIKERRVPDAERAFLESAALFESRFGPMSVQLMEPLDGLRQVYFQQKKFAQSEEKARTVLTIADQVYGVGDTRGEKAINNVIAVACVSGKCKDETELTARLLAVRLKAYGPNHINTRAARLLMAESYRHRGQHAESAKLLEENVRACEAVAPGELVMALNNLAYALSLAGQTQRGLEVAQRAADLQKTARVRTFRPDAVSTLKVQAALLAAAGRYAESEQAYKRLLELAEDVYGPRYPHLPDFMLELSEVLQKQGKTAQASAVHAEAERLYKPM